MRRDPLPERAEQASEAQRVEGGIPDQMRCSWRNLTARCFRKPLNTAWLWQSSFTKDTVTSGGSVFSILDLHVSKRASVASVS